MRRPLASRTRFAALLTCAAVITAAMAAAPARAAGPLQTALVGSSVFYGADGNLAFSRAHDARASAIRLQLSWRDTAPPGATRPAGFDPTNPADPAYRWGPFDKLVESARANELEPFIGISEAPDWAQRGTGGRPGTNSPDPAELGYFAQAAAERYGGSFAGLPRVRTWEVWNEANASFFLYPQEVSHRALSPAIYRAMVNSFAAGVKRIHADNDVVAGALFPFVINTQSTQAIGPLRFMRGLLCMSKRLRPLSGCGAPVHFDIWSHHPYTSGGPTHKAANPNSVSIGELPQMRRLIEAAVHFKRIVHHGRVRLWVTEFGWDTNPPDPNGVPLRLHARWVAEALYRMWRSGVSLVTWFQLRDDAANGRPASATFQSGLYARCAAGPACDLPKLALRSFRFPFVAFRSGARVLVWGRTPAESPGEVIVEQASGNRWKRLARLRSNRYGIFLERLRTPRDGALRARAPGAEVARPFSLHRPPDRQVNPFG